MRKEGLENSKHTGYTEKNRYIGKQSKLPKVLMEMDSNDGEGTGLAYRYEGQAIMALHSFLSPEGTQHIEEPGNKLYNAC